MGKKARSHIFLSFYLTLNCFFVSAVFAHEKPISQNDVLLNSDSIRELYVIAFNLRKSNIDSGLMICHSLLEKRDLIDSLILSDIYSVTGTLYQNKRDFAQASEFFHKSLTIREALMDDIKIATVSLNLGNLHYFRNQDSSALNYLYKSLFHLENADAPPKLLNKVTNSLAQVYAEQGVPDSVEKYLKITSDYLAQMDDSTGKSQVDILSNLAVIQEQNYEWREARKILYRVMEIQEKNKDEQGLSWTLHHLGMCFEGSGYLDTAFYHYQKAYALAQNVNDVLVQSEVAFSISKLAFKLERISEGEQYLSLYKMLIDSLTNSRIQKSIQEEEAKYKVRKTQSEKLLMEEQAARSQAEAESQQRLNYILLGVLFTLSLVFIFGYRSYQQRRYINKMELSLKDQELKELLADQERASFAAMLEGQEGERQRIARDLHDRVGNLLATLRMSVNQNGNGKPETEVELIDRTVMEVRNIAHNLSAGVIEKYGLNRALEELKTLVERSGPMKMDLYLDPGAKGMGQKTALEIYRIVQELVGNTLKHAQARNISIQTTFHQEGFNLIYEDDGQGFDPNVETEGMGLRNIRNRMDLLKGTLSIDTHPGRGTIVILDSHV